MKNYHILNGDALLELFPGDELEGELIVCRECLVSGPVASKNLDELKELRANFLSDAFHGTPEDYQKKVDTELSKVLAISKGNVYLWFEEDLFCQVNLWFICSLLYKKDVDVFLVVPKNSLRYGFGGFDQKGLVSTFKNRKQLTTINVNQFALLWFAYRNEDLERLLKLGVQLYQEFPFVKEAVAAHFERIPKGDDPGKPIRIIKSIMLEKGTSDFRSIFKEFSRRAPIYGFGDLQVKQLIESLD